MKNNKLFKISERVTVVYHEDAVSDEIVTVSFTLPCGAIVENAEHTHFWGRELRIYKADSNKEISYEEVVAVINSSEVLDITKIDEEDMVDGYNVLTRYVGNNDFVVVTKSYK